LLLATGRIITTSRHPRSRGSLSMSTSVGEDSQSLSAGFTRPPCPTPQRPSSRRATHSARRRSRQAGAIRLSAFCFEIGDGMTVVQSLFELSEVDPKPPAPWHR
jgi:hypothetical protein